MKLRLIMKSARSAVIEINDGGVFYCKREYKVVVNGNELKSTNRVITSIFGLKPETEYRIAVMDDDGNQEEISFTTDYEFVTLNVLDFGAKGDGKTEDTLYIQSAIMACPENGRVLIPAGNYLITSLFLKSNIKLELEKDAVLEAVTKREKFPILPGLIESYDESDEYNLGTWEGNPLKMFSGILTGINVENVLIYGEGTINGSTTRENWWNEPKVMKGAFRPRLLYLNHCKNISVQGITFKNSPSWTIHPYFSDDLNFYNLFVNNPYDSPNTDGLDPESCKNVSILGVYFSLGDDCIAVKSGKLYMGQKYKTPSENLEVRQCLMENGHGAVTIGSEMAGGVKNLRVSECLFQNTDRGLRIKTRRGRGKQAVVENITFENIKMDNVMTPFVANSFYFCDPDGHSDYVQCKEALPVDDRTPHIKSIYIRDVECTNCHVAVVFFYGLPEKKIECVEMTNVKASFAEHTKRDVPAMMDSIEPVCKQGIIVNNVETMILNHVEITGCDGEVYQIQNVDKLAMQN